MASKCNNGSDGKDHVYGQSAGVAPLPEAEPPQAASGMGESVTPHVVNPPEEGRRLLVCGVDSLDLSGYVNWGEGWSKLKSKLESGKDNARRASQPIFFQDTLVGPLLILPTGKPPMFRYHLQCTDFHFFVGVSPDATDHTPNVFVSFNSRLLWREGVSKSIRLVKKLIMELGGHVRQLKPSRLDLCADFLIPNGLELDTLLKLGVPENIKTNNFLDGARLKTFYVGSPKSTIRARIYDKADEVLVHHKEWFKDIWGVDIIKDVWRIEFQLRREALRAYGVESDNQLKDSLGGIWADLTGSWFSLRLLDNPRTARRSYLPFWKEVQACAEHFGPVQEMKRKLRKGSKATPDFYIKRAATMLLGFAASAGLPDLDESIAELVYKVRQCWDAEDFFEAYRVKIVELGCGSVSADDEGGEDGIPF